MNKITSLEELKEIATKHLALQLDMLRKLPSLNAKDALYFSQWYTFNSLQDDITNIAIRLKKLKKIIENRNITYPMYCNLIDMTAEYLKQQGKIWFDTQASLINNQKQIVTTNPLWYYNPYYFNIYDFTRKQSN